MIKKKIIQGWTNRWAIGCVNSPLGKDSQDAESRNLGPTFFTINKSEENAVLIHLSVIRHVRNFLRSPTRKTLLNRFGNSFCNEIEV